MREVRDRDEILCALSQEERALHLYEIGDLDDFFFPATRWFVPTEGGPPLALVYGGTELPVLLAITSEHLASLTTLLEDLPLPPRVYAHLSPGLVDVLAKRYAVEPHGRHTKMALRGALPKAGPCRALLPSDVDALHRFYAHAYPGNWFDPRMLETGVYRAVEHDGEVIAAGGIHVFSKAQGVAALGNIAVHPAHRGRGVGAAVTTAVCHAIRDAGITEIGLNVKSDNEVAIRCYERLGFVRIGEYDEYLLTS